MKKPRSFAAMRPSLFFSIQRRIAPLQTEFDALLLKHQHGKADTADYRRMAEIEAAMLRRLGFLIASEACLTSEGKS